MLRFVDLIPQSKQVEPTSGTWNPSWTNGLVAAVVVIAVVISMLLFFALLLFQSQKDLLGMMTVGVMCSKCDFIIT